MEPGASADQTPLARRLDEAAEWYDDLTALRAAISLIPYVGGALDILVSGRASQIHRERLVRLIDELRDDYARLGEDKIDRDFLASDEFFDFFRDAAERYTRSHGDEKLEALRNAFVNGTTTEGSQGPLKEVVLRMAGDLTDGHMTVLTAVCRQDLTFTDKHHEENQDYVDSGHLVTATGLDQSLTITLAQDLIGLGLLEDWWRDRLGAGGRARERYSLSHFGREFIRFITHPGDRREPAA